MLQVVTRRFNRKEEGQPMIGTVSKTTLGTMIKKQLQIWMPHEMILMNQPIASYGEFKIPLNLKGTDGQQLELTVDVRKTWRIKS